MSARSWLPPPRACGCRARPHGPGRQEPRRAGVSRVAGLPHAAECNKAPFMYEMKGALFGYAAPARPVADRLVPVPPVSRLRRTSLAAFPAAPTRLGRIPGSPFPDRLGCPGSPFPDRLVPSLTVPGSPSSQPHRLQFSWFQPHRSRIAWFPRLTVSGSAGFPPRRSGPSGCPSAPAPRAARRCQAPAANTGFPAFPAPRGSPRDGARFLR